MPTALWCLAIAISTRHASEELQSLRLGSQDQQTPEHWLLDVKFFSPPNGAHGRLQLTELLRASEGGCCLPAAIVLGSSSSGLSKWTIGTEHLSDGGRGSRRTGDGVRTKKKRHGTKYANNRRDKANKCFGTKNTNETKKQQHWDKIKSDKRDKKTLTRGPEGWSPEPRGPPKGGAPKGGGPKISRFFPPLPLPFSFLFSLFLWESSRGILVVFEAPGPSDVHDWSSLDVE